MDKYSLIKKIEDIESLTSEERSAIIELLRKQKKYGLVWEEKTEDVEERLRDELPVLREVKERAIIGDDKDAPNHILIEGDNLEALTTLSYTHAGKIDVIYIDPPYNTGNKDFVYNDRYVDSEDSYRHSKWLSFMNKRLKIAKQLLSDKGVIFISIDNNEQAQLKLLCDEVFLAKNFLGNIIWQSATDNNPRQISTEHEYVICYAKQFDKQDKWLITSLKAQLINSVYQKIKATCIDTAEIQAELRKWIKNNRANLKGVEHYNNVDERGVYSSSSNSSNTKPGGYTFDIIHPKTKRACAKPAFGWRWKEETFWTYAAAGDVEWGKDETTQPHIKKRIDTVVEQLKSIYYEDGRASTRLVENIFNGVRVFNNPKPTNLVKRLEAFASKRDSTILDFFAGSGTTMHATMLLNSEDGGRRQCILVTNNENNICEEVTYERNKRVIEGYTTPKGEAVEGLKGNNLRYYKTEFVSRDRTAKNMRRLTSLATDMLCIKENLYAEQPSFGKHKTHPGIFRYFSEGERRMLIIYHEEAVAELTDEISDIELTEPIRVYVFSPSEDPWEGMFEDVQEKVELCALPQAIYNAYQRILPRRRDTVVYVKPDKEASQTEEII